jgi:hypothetical protein
MDDRWKHASTRLRQIEPPSDLWDRISDGPRLPALPPARRTRVAAAVTAFAVFAVAVALLWVALAPRHSDVDTLAGPDVVAVPPRGEVSAIFLGDGRPVFVVHHQDGAVSVVDAFSSHRAWGVEELNVWCAPTREFVEWAHETRYDEYGRYADVGPAPTGLPTFAFDPVETDASGDPVSIRVGAMRPASPEGSGPVSAPTRPDYCPGADGEGSILAHTVPEAAVFATPGAAVEAAPDGWVAIRGTLLVASDGFVRLCAEVDGERCRNGAIVRGIDGVGLMVNVTSSPDVTGYEVPHVWLARVHGGVLDDLAIGDLRVEG